VKPCLLYMDILDYFAGILPAMLEDYNEKGLRVNP
jgi:hypothetical protein